MVGTPIMRGDRPFVLNHLIIKIVRLQWGTVTLGLFTSRHYKVSVNHDKHAFFSAATTVDPGVDP
jgi:hypothetical protein